MKDEADQKAEVILPCDCGGVYEGGGKVNPERHAGPRDENCCAAFYRPAVAAALKAERDAAYVRGLERAKEIVYQLFNVLPNGLVNAIQAEIDRRLPNRAK